MYSTLSSHRNRPAGGSQSISKCAREIGPTVSQFLNVQGKFSDHRCQYWLPELCSITSGKLDACLRGSILGLFKIILNISQNQTQKAGERAFFYLAFTVGTCFCCYVLGCMGRAARPGPGHSTHYLLSRFLFITLRVVSQFLYTTGKLGAKISVSVSISRFLRLDNVLYRTLVCVVPESVR